jgi:hypothetical protein
MTYESRKFVGDLHERRVGCELAARGWSVSPFGQGFLSGCIQQALRGSTSGLRYSPDLLAARGDTVVAVDCKGRMPDTTTEQYSLNKEAVRAYCRFVACMDVPLVCVFDDLKVLTPAEVMALARPTRRAYYLIGSALARPFNDVFGVPSVQDAFVPSPVRDMVLAS